MGKKFEDESLIQRLGKTLKHSDGLTASSKNYELQHFIPKYVCIPADSLKLFQLNKPCTRSKGICVGASNLGKKRDLLLE